MDRYRGRLWPVRRAREWLTRGASLLADSGRVRGAISAAERWSPPVSRGLALLGLGLGLFYIATLGDSGGVDGRAYFLADAFAPYARGSHLLGPDAYLYSPAFAQVIAPLRWLGWPAFVVSLRLMELGALVYIAGPLTPFVLFWSPVASELNAANIHLLMGAAAIYGLRQPGAWAFILLTKVTPGVGLLWFAVRREWAALRTALLVTAAVAAVSFVLAPGAWSDWFAALAYNAGHPVQFSALMPTSVALLIRVPLAAVLVVVGARMGWTWVLPGAVTLALPAVWYHALSILTGIPRRIWADWNYRCSVRSGTGSQPGAPAVPPSASPPPGSGLVFNANNDDHVLAPPGWACSGSVGEDGSSELALRPRFARSRFRSSPYAP